MKAHTKKIIARSGVALLTLAWATGLQAQDIPTGPQAAGPTTTTAEDEVAGEVIVTGSRLRGTAPVGSSVIALGREDVIASGAVTTDRLINLPGVGLVNRSRPIVGRLVHPRWAG